MTRHILPGPFSDLRPASLPPFCPFAQSPFLFPYPLLPLPLSSALMLNTNDLAEGRRWYRSRRLTCHLSTICTLAERSLPLPLPLSPSLSPSPFPSPSLPSMPWDCLAW